MIRHIFTIIWNERKANGWILVEYIFVFCVLWFCCDYLYYMERTRREPTGFDTGNTYRMYITRSSAFNEEDFDESVFATTLLERLKLHPAVESACISSYILPYSGGIRYSTQIAYPDTVRVDPLFGLATPEIIDVFKIKLQSGRLPDIHDLSAKEVLIYPDGENGFGYYNDKSYPAEQVHSIADPRDTENKKRVTGILSPLKRGIYEPYHIGVLEIKKAGDLDIEHSEIVIRIKPQQNISGFEKQFQEEMREQLALGPYRLASIKSFKTIEQDTLQSWGIYNNLKSVYAITLFLFINIFLGVIGTFWYRTQSRLGEVGLRIAMGATRQKIITMMSLETIFLLFIASLVGVNICLHLAQSDLLTILGLPLAEWGRATAIPGKNGIIYLFTFFLLAIISLIAVCYPAWKASIVQPAEALRNE